MRENIAPNALTTGGYCGGRYGPKRTIMASCVVAGLGWLLIGLSPGVPWLVLGRVICGIGSSFSTANCSLLVAQYRYRPLPWWLRLNWRKYSVN